MFGKLRLNQFFSSSRPMASGENGEDLTLLTEAKANDSVMDIIPEEAEQTTNPLFESPLNTFQRYFPEPIIWSILEYNLDDLPIIKKSSELLAKMFHNEPQLASIILLLTEIGRINTLSLSLNTIAKQRSITGSRALMLIFSLLYTPGIGGLAWYTRELHNKFFALQEPIEQVKNIVFQSCLTYPRSIYVNWSTCDYTEDMLIQNFKCSAAVLKANRFDEICNDSSNATGAVVSCAIGTAFSIVGLIIILFFLNKSKASFCSDKESDLSSKKYIPLPQRQEIAALLKGPSDDLTGFTLGMVLQELQIALKSAIQSWKIANSEAGFDMVLPCLEDNSSENFDSRKVVLDAMIYGRHGYLARHGQLMFSGEPAVAVNETNTNSNILS